MDCDELAAGIHNSADRDIVSAIAILITNRGREAVALAALFLKVGQDHADRGRIVGTRRECPENDEGLVIPDDLDEKVHETITVEIPEPPQHDR